MKRLGRFFLVVMILPAYKVQLNLSKVVNKFYAPQKSRHYLIHSFSRRYLIHLIIIFVSFFVVAANLNANEIRKDDNFKESSVAAKLLINDNLGVIEEEGPLPTTKKITRYLEQTGINSQPHLLGQEAEVTTITSVTAGETAVVSPVISPAEQELRQRDKVIYYKVEQGDTISSIAEKFSISSNTILWDNNLTAYSIIRPGDTLSILPTSGLQHQVLKGESLQKIANKYDIDINKILEFNKLSSVDDIKIGEKIIIPGGKKIIEQPVYTVRNIASTITKGTPQPAVKVLGTGKMTWPASCRYISQYYRWRHTGLDIACGFGKPLYAADSGKVIKAQGGYNGGYGIMVIIDHGNGLQTLYGHLSTLYVSVGQTISRGQNIGLMGSTGRSTGPHVHFEVIVKGSKVNPLGYIK